jgi:hypothetical protein
MMGSSILHVVSVSVEGGLQLQLHIFSSERMLRKDYDRKCSVEKNTDRESQGACRQDELIGG